MTKSCHSCPVMQEKHLYQTRQDKKQSTLEKSSLSHMLYHFGSGQNNCLADKKKKQIFLFFQVASGHKIVKGKKYFQQRKKQINQLPFRLQLTAMQEIHILLDQAARRKGSSVLCPPICTAFPPTTLIMFPVVQKKSSTYLETINHTSEFINHKIPSVILHEKWPSMANFSSLVLSLNNTVMLEGRLKIPAKNLF